MCLVEVLFRTFLTCSFNHAFVSSGEEIPDPIKLVRRLTALENALGRLQVDCEAIATKRMGIVNSIIKAQNSNVVQIQEVRGLNRTSGVYVSSRYGEYWSLTATEITDARPDRKQGSVLLPRRR